MRFGHFCLPTFFPESDGDQGRYLQRLVDFLASSEDLGFDALWANEHHFHPYGGMLPSPPIMLATLAQRTKRVRLGTSVIVLPLHNPIETAEQLAMVDLLSGGRLELGFGRGFVVRDYEVLGVPYETAQEQTLEALEVILKAWSGEPFTHEGRHYRYPHAVTVWPQPAQRPHPPVWMAATAAPTSFQHAGEHGFNLLTVAWVNPLAKLGGLVNTYRDAFAATGRDPARAEVCSHYQVLVAEDRDEARRIAREALNRYIGINTAARSQAQEARLQAMADNVDYGVNVDNLVDEGRVLAGTPDDVAAQLLMAHEAVGMTVVDCNFYFGGMPFEAAQRSLRLFGQEVIPQVRGLGGVEASANGVAHPERMTLASGAR